MQQLRQVSIRHELSIGGDIHNVYRISDQRISPSHSWLRGIIYLGIPIRATTEDQTVPNSQC